ncbi:MAG: polyphosphate polymerase domain-containing protein [Flavobacteriaceae bacterium]|nr:polyphosphate polymerase domain-containing protein [Flavobacteriaceae bacterium]
MAKYRYERKYYVPNDRLKALRKRLLPFVVADAFTGANEEGVNEYKVQSIYFDTPFMDYYEEKKEGLELRNKFRIRGYGKYFQGITAFLEIKHKTGNRISKTRSPYQFDHSYDLLLKGNVDCILTDVSGHEKALESANKYLYRHFRNSLRPVNLVVYEREAYVGLFDKDIRITFDKNIRTAIYPKIQELFDCHRLKYLNPLYFVLEVKYSNEPPIWVLDIIEEFSLSLKAISKYADGLDTHIGGKKLRFSPTGFTNLNYI